MVGKVDIATQQIYKTIQNKIPLDKGIVRKSLEVDKGYVSALHNFEIKNGETLTVRPGTRVMNSMQDQQFYFVESFKMSNMNIVIGLNYKRELWAWLEKWPETDFKVCNTSPFKKYRHKDSGGNTFYSPHFSFTKGNKFFVGEDDFSIIIFNDFGEIFRLMKVGSIRITTDADVVDQETSIEDARDAYLFTGRIWLDIKEATNKVFDNKMFIGDEYIRNSHRITGETRFAYVNELSVISELSDPINIEDYRHIISSLNPILNYDKNKKVIPFKRTVTHGATADDNCKIYATTSTSIDIVANEGEVWTPSNPFTTDVNVSAIIVEIKNMGKWYDAAGNLYEINSGIYLCAIDKDTGSAITIDDTSAWNSNIVELALRSPAFFARESGGPAIVQIAPIWKDENKLLKFDSNSTVMPTIERTDNTKSIGFFRVKFYGGEFQRFVSNYKVSSPGGIFEFLGNVKITSGAVWNKLVDYSTVDEGYSSENTAFQITQPKSVPTDFPYIFGFGKVYVADFKMKKNISGKYGWHESNIMGFESEFDSSLTYNQWKNIGYDSWDLIKRGLLSLNNVNLKDKSLSLNGIDDETQVITSSELSSISSLDGRFALWNDSHVMGISQRFFIENVKEEIVYRGSQQFEGGNINVRDNEIDYEDYSVGYAPLMTLDYTGLRKIPMPLPLIRRAMRNPQFVVVAGSNVYSVEDNKIWVGSVSDCMMVDEIELHSAIYDVKAFGSGMIASTKNGLFLVERGSDVKRVIDGDSVIPRFMAVCSGGVLVVEDNNIYVVHRKVTSTGSWYPTLTQINEQIVEANFEGKLKSVSIGDIIYLADEYTVWLYDIKKGIWCGQYIYGENGEKIQDLFVFNSKLGVIFETGINREKSFDAPDSDIR